jgi:signal transduction histidine kinase
MSKNDFDVTPNLYETDFYAWTQEQAQFLQLKQWDKIDLLNLIEEIESLGKRERAELRNRLSVLIGHLLKWHYQASKRTRSWLNTICVQRIDILELLKENPSLKFYLEEALQIAYIKGIALAAGETNLPRKIFPDTCPYALEEILSDRFYPGEPAEDKLME